MLTFPEKSWRVRSSRVRCFQNIQCSYTASDTIVILPSCTQFRASLTRSFTIASILQYYFFFSFCVFLSFFLSTSFHSLPTSFLTIYIPTYLCTFYFLLCCFLSLLLILLLILSFFFCFLTPLLFLNLLQNFPSFSLFPMLLFPLLSASFNLVTFFFFPALC